jgi:hypothetical protein
MLDGDEHAQALRDLEEFAHDLAAGRAPRSSDITPTLRALRLGSTRGNWLLRIMSETSARLTDSEAARRQFFHAARAFIFLRRDPILAA